MCSFVSSVDLIKVQFRDPGDNLEKTTLFSIALRAEITGDRLMRIPQGRRKTFCFRVAAVWFAVEDQGEDGFAFSHRPEFFDLFVHPLGLRRMR